MEGVLYKWTNYLSGWQPRWFLLAGGVLSYYDSREDAWKGCKGSIQMAVCEIQVHPTDNTRVDLIIPGEQYFYLKSKNAADRQKWLVALGTAKACLTDIRTLKEKEFSENTDALKTKMAELRLYCDLLVQQADKTKNGVDTGALLTTTCTTFLKTLDECMQIANVAFSSELLYQPTSGSPHSAFYKLNKLKLPSIFSRGVAERQMELKNTENGYIYANANLPEQTPVLLKTGERDHEKLITDGSKKDGKDKLLPKIPDRDTKSLELPADSIGKSTPLSEETNKDFKTFFSAMSIRFSDIELSEDEGIPTEEFLRSCYEIVPVLDKLGPTVFAPVKMDFEGNIKKINQKYITSKDDFHTLQKLILHEVSSGDAQLRNSATEALMWLKRGLKFLKEFLIEIKNGEKNIQTALNHAYGKTLRQYHGWVVRGVFALALRASPTYEGFALALSIGEHKYQEDIFYNSMQRDLDIYLPAMEKQLSILDALYEEHGLESNEVV
ncbi:pleckstrin homology domain-containing family A member 8 [Anolis carolinensis]|uniref:Pleckstrin homology domain-containing family A member 8 n=1 Tax=Anolis carolinensis TaxID=28377 RepID=R4GC20_ANOCA|nr:PREDICTED: pleckstrin homology domain-containing family A member 8 [Anolis carolinensis]|eukprot:XP_008110951.1 PREDICTED: pleckstrin homology domain-containing family A member 8 [Anolis carolinensis]